VHPRSPVAAATRAVAPRQANLSDLLEILQELLGLGGLVPFRLELEELAEICCCQLVLALSDQHQTAIVVDQGVVGVGSCRRFELGEGAFQIALVVEVDSGVEIGVGREVLALGQAGYKLLRFVGAPFGDEEVADQLQGVDIVGLEL
jgi:hypothetical protein